MNIESIVRPHLLTIEPYRSARVEYTGEGTVWLDANESAEDTGYNRYPDSQHVGLKEVLGQVKGVATEQIFIGHGSDEIIDLLIRAFCEPGIDKVCIPVPTYGMYRVSAAVHNIAVLEVPLAKNFQLDVEGILLAARDPSVKLIFLCSPNNPTGNLLNQRDILTILNDFNGLVIVDEAYIEYAGSPGLTPLLETYNNLVVLQTLSKAWGLAGLRLGVGLMHPKISFLLTRIKPPYNISSHTQKIALTCLRSPHRIDAQIEKVRKLRKRLATALRDCAIVEAVYPSDANFLLIRFKNVKTVFRALVDQGIIVRNRSNLVPSTLRITIGTEAEVDAVIQVIQNFE